MDEARLHNQQIEVNATYEAQILVFLCCLFRRGWKGDTGPCSLPLQKVLR